MSVAVDVPIPDGTVDCPLVGDDELDDPVVVLDGDVMEPEGVVVPPVMAPLVVDPPVIEPLLVEPLVEDGDIDEVGVVELSVAEDVVDVGLLGGVDTVADDVEGGDALEAVAGVVDASFLLQPYAEISNATAIPVVPSLFMGFSVRGDCNSADLIALERGPPEPPAHPLQSRQWNAPILAQRQYWRYRSLSGFAVT